MVFYLILINLDYLIFSHNQMLLSFCPFVQVILIIHLMSLSFPNHILSYLLIDQVASIAFQKNWSVWVEFENPILDTFFYIQVIEILVCNLIIKHLFDIYLILIMECKYSYLLLDQEEFLSQWDLFFGFQNSHKDS